jgi:hypothetical protein
MVPEELTKTHFQNSMCPSSKRRGLGLLKMSLSLERMSLRQFSRVQEEEKMSTGDEEMGMGEIEKAHSHQEVSLSSITMVLGSMNMMLFSNKMVLFRNQPTPLAIETVVSRSKTRPFEARTAHRSKLALVVGLERSVALDVAVDFALASTGRTGAGTNRDDGPGPSPHHRRRGHVQRYTPEKFSTRGGTIRRVRRPRRDAFVSSR